LFPSSFSVISIKSTTPCSPWLTAIELSLLVAAARLYSSSDERNLGGEVFPIITSPSAIFASG